MEQMVVITIPALFAASDLLKKISKNSFNCFAFVVTYNPCEITNPLILLLIGFSDQRKILVR
jgi:malate/lactate dehydrogenase